MVVTKKLRSDQALPLYIEKRGTVFVKYVKCRRCSCTSSLLPRTTHPSTSLKTPLSTSLGEPLLSRSALQGQSSFGVQSGIVSALSQESTFSPRIRAQKISDARSNRETPGNTQISEMRLSVRKLRIKRLNAAPSPAELLRICRHRSGCEGSGVNQWT